MSTYLLGVGAALAVTALVLEMMRRGVLREHFAAMWLAVSAFLVAVALFPGLLERSADTLGFSLPSNLLFFLAIVFLLLVSVQLSFEVSKLEARTRRLAEDLALLAAEHRRATPARPGSDGLGGPHAPSSPRSHDGAD